MSVHILEAPEPVDTESALTTFNQIDAALAEVRRQAHGVVFDLTKTADNEAARRLRQQLVRLRTGLDKLRKKLNADDQARITARNGEAARISSAIKALEDPLNADIAADEVRREALRQEKALAEQRRIEEHEHLLRHIRARLTAAIGAPALEVEASLQALQALPARDWQEYASAAAEAVQEVVRGLQSLLQSAREREELQRLREQEQQREALQARAQHEAEAAQAQREREREAVEASRQHAAKLEEDRKAQARDFIRSIELAPNTCIGMASPFIERELQRLHELSITALDEFTGEAQAARSVAINSLNEMRAQTLEAERIAAQHAAAQRELDARRRAEAEQEVTREAKAKAESEAAAAEERRRTRKLRDAADLMFSALQAVRECAPAWDALSEAAANQVETALAAAQEPA